VKLENLEALRERLYAYGKQSIHDDMMHQSLEVDTKLYHHEMNQETVKSINKLAPFGEGNEEPLFLIEDLTLTHVEKVGKNGSGHLKMHVVNPDNTKFHALFRGE